WLLCGVHSPRRDKPRQPAGRSPAALDGNAPPCTRWRLESISWATAQLRCVHHAPPHAIFQTPAGTRYRVRDVAIGITAARLTWDTDHVVDRAAFKFRFPVETLRARRGVPGLRPAPQADDR